MNTSIITPDIETFNKLIDFKDDDYKQLKTEMSLFYAKKRDKKFMLYATPVSPFHLASEIVFKIIPICEFIIVRNVRPSVTDKLKIILQEINYYDLQRFTCTLSSESVYGKDLMQYKLNALVNRQKRKLESLLLYFFNLQPTKERQFAQGTVGIGVDEFNELNADSGSSEPLGE
jgi:hypothetical protein